MVANMVEGEEVGPLEATIRNLQVGIGCSEVPLGCAALRIQQLAGARTYDQLLSRHPVSYQPTAQPTAQTTFQPTCSVRSTPRAQSRATCSGAGSQPRPSWSRCRTATLPSQRRWRACAPRSRCWCRKSGSYRQPGVALSAAGGCGGDQAKLHLLPWLAFLGGPRACANRQYNRSRLARRRRLESSLESHQKDIKQLAAAQGRLHVDLQRVNGLIAANASARETLAEDNLNLEAKIQGGSGFFCCF